ncbi:MAG TPA: hypothetical protein VHK91_11400 [Flavisolibacter sp.]|jgi:predicted transcriptional regulator YdeE|nr:hypothetical protein [Flavisolibacter sp.]
MELFPLENDLHLTGLRVSSFPNGIKEVFDRLYQSYGAERDYYGVSWMNEQGQVIYYAMTRKEAIQAYPSEFETIIIPHGAYRTEIVLDWMRKTDCIKDVFHNLMTGLPKPDRNRPCIEWYQSDDKMLCMVRTD